MGIHEIIGISSFECFDNLLIGSIGPPKADVFLNASVEQDWLLPHISNLLSIVLQVDVFEVVAINENLPFSGVIESLQQLNEGALA